MKIKNTATQAVLLLLAIALACSLAFALDVDIAAKVNTNATYNATTVELQRGNTEFSLKTIEYQSLISSEPSLVAYWPLNGSWNDVEGSRNLTAYGATFGSGRFTGYYSADLDGSDDYAKTEDTTNPLGTGTGKTFTIELWFNADALSLYTPLVSIGQQAAGKLACVGIDNGSGSRVYVDTYAAAYYLSTTINTGNWYLLALTGDGTNFRVYLNTSLLDTRAKNPDFGDGSAYINALFNGTYFNGRIAHVAVYNSALSIDTITSHYNATPFATNSPVIDPVYLVDCGSNSCVYNFANDDLNFNLAGETGSVKCQYSVDTGTPSYNGSYLTAAQWATEGTKTGRYKRAKCQLNSDGTQDASLDDSSFRVSGGLGGQQTLMGGN